MKSKPLPEPREMTPKHGSLHKQLQEETLLVKALHLMTGSLCYYKELSLSRYFQQLSFKNLSIN